MRQRALTLINQPSKGCCADPAWILQFGAYGWTSLLVYARSLNDALDECVDWLVKHAPGILADEAVRDEFKRLTIEFPDMPEDDAWEAATVDTTCAGNAGNYLHSWEWSVAIEDASPKQIANYYHGR